MWRVAGEPVDLPKKFPRRMPAAEVAMGLEIKLFWESRMGLILREAEFEIPDTVLKTVVEGYRSVQLEAPWHLERKCPPRVFSLISKFLSI